jgi:hypothetical protein
MQRQTAGGCVHGSGGRRADAAAAVGTQEAALVAGSAGACGMALAPMLRIQTVDGQLALPWRERGSWLPRIYRGMGEWRRGVQGSDLLFPELERVMSAGPLSVAAGYGGRRRSWLEGGGCSPRKRAREGLGQGLGGASVWAKAVFPFVFLHPKDLPIAVIYVASSNWDPAADSKSTQRNVIKLSTDQTKRTPDISYSGDPTVDIS